MKLGEKIRKNTLWLFTGSITSRMLAFFSGIVLARILVPEDFGLLVTTQIFTGIVSIFAGSGMGQALIRAKDVESKHYNVVFSLQFLLSIIIYSGFYLSSQYIASYFDNQLYEELLKVSAIGFILRPINNICKAKLSREYHFKQIAILNVIGIFTTSVLGIYFAYIGWGVWALIISGLLGTAILMPIYLTTAKWTPRICFDYKIAKHLGGYGFKVAISHLLYFITTQIPNFIISKQFGPSSVGLFNKAMSTSVIPQQLIGTSVTQTLFRGMSESQSDLNTTKYLYTKTLSLLALYQFPFYVSMLWLSEPFIVIVYGDNWREAGQLMQIVAMLGFFSTITSPASTLNDAHDRLKQEIKLDIQFIILMVLVLVMFANDSVYHLSTALIFLSAFQALRVTRLAFSCMPGLRFIDFVNSITPALVLNLLLFGCFFILNYYIELSQINNLLVLLVVIFSAVLFYLFMIIFTPLQGISSERNRIKSKFIGILKKPH